MFRVQPLASEEAERVAAASRVAFTFLVRDGERYLSRNLKALFELGRTFREFRIFYVENDSKDSTRSVLRAFSERDHGVMTGKLLNNLSAHSYSLCPREELGQINCRNRTSLLANLRQRVLSMALQWPAWDAVTMIDIDFACFSASEYMRTFALGLHLNASAVFSNSMYPNKQGHLMPYDRSSIYPSFLRLHLPSKRVFGPSALPRPHAQQCLVRVTSAFGGFGTYFAKPLRAALAGSGRRCGLRPPTYKGEEQVPEHVTFNRRLAHVSGNPMFIDPTFEPIYNYAEGIGKLFRLVDPRKAKICSIAGKSNRHSAAYIAERAAVKQARAARRQRARSKSRYNGTRPMNKSSLANNVGAPR